MDEDPCDDEKMIFNDFEQETSDYSHSILLLFWLNVMHSGEVQLINSVDNSNVDWLQILIHCLKIKHIHWGLILGCNMTITLMRFAFGQQIIDYMRVLIILMHGTIKQDFL